MLSGHVGMGGAGASADAADVENGDAATDEDGIEHGPPRARRQFRSVSRPWS